MTIVAIGCLLFTAGLLSYVFLLPSEVEATTEKTRAAYLRERKDQVYENLRDLNFEYKAGKMPEADYQPLRAAMEEEAAAILAELENLEKPFAKLSSPPKQARARG
jgi:hypothetical protein